MDRRTHHHRRRSDQPDRPDLNASLAAVPKQDSGTTRREPVAGHMAAPPGACATYHPTTDTRSRVLAAAPGENDRCPNPTSCTQT
jgi:hypothetical protein